MAVGDDRHLNAARPAGADSLRQRGRDAHLFGEALGRDLVPHQAHHRRIGTDEHDPEPLAQLRELRPLGHESPADPSGIGAGRAISARSSTP